MKMNSYTGVYMLREGEWKACVNGKIIKTEFNSKRAAQAAIPVEEARQVKQGLDKIKRKFK